MMQSITLTSLVRLSLKKMQLKKMEACADSFMEDANEFGESDYERDDQVDVIILTSNNASCDVYISIQETTLNE